MERRVLFGKVVSWEWGFGWLSRVLVFLEKLMLFLKGFLLNFFYIERFVIIIIVLGVFIRESFDSVVRWSRSGLFMRSWSWFYLVILVFVRLFLARFGSCRGIVGCGCW